MEGPCYSKVGTYSLFYIFASEALQKPDGMVWKKGSFYQYSWNSEVEANWKSLIGWPLRTSNTYMLFLAFVGN